MPKAADTQVSMWPTPEVGVPAYELLARVFLDLPRWPLAACRDMAPQIFDASTAEDARAALGVCLGCQVQAQCLAWAQAQDARMRKGYGVQGGWDGVVGGQLFGKARKWADEGETC